MPQRSPKQRWQNLVAAMAVTYEVCRARQNNDEQIIVFHDYIPQVNPGLRARWHNVIPALHGMTPEGEPRHFRSPDFMLSFCLN